MLPLFRQHSAARVFVLLTIAYWVVTLLLMYHLGIKVVNDSPRYLRYAAQLRSGFYMDPHDFWYFGYVAFVYLIRLFTEAVSAIIIAQCLLGYLAVLSLYHTSLLLFQSRQAALFTGLAYIFFIDIPAWHAYVLTESFYMSFTCFSFYGLARLYRTPRALGLYLPVLLVVVITVLCKPTGIALLGALGVLMLYGVWQQLRHAMARGLLALVAGGIFLLLVNKMLGAFHMIDDYHRGELIYGIRTMPDHRHIHLLALTPPAPIYQPAASAPPLLQIILFIMHHPGYWLQLLVAKVGYFLGHVRPYWSWYHNVFVLAFLLPAYTLMGRLAIRRRLPAPIAWFAGTYAFIHVCSVGFTTVDWDGRFLMPLLPLIFLLSGYALSLLPAMHRLMAWRRTAAVM